MMEFFNWPSFFIGFFTGILAYILLSVALLKHEMNRKSTINLKKSKKNS